MAELEGRPELLEGSAVRLRHARARASDEGDQRDQTGCGAASHATCFADVSGAGMDRDDGKTTVIRDLPARRPWQRPGEGRRSSDTEVIRRQGARYGRRP